jgi:hypothetical protein
LRTPILAEAAKRFVELAVVAKKVVVVALVVVERVITTPIAPLGVISVVGVEVAHLLLPVPPAPPPESSASQPNCPSDQVRTLFDSQLVSPAPEREARLAIVPVIVPPVISGLVKSAF